MSLTDPSPPDPPRAWYRYFIPWLVIALLTGAVVGSLYSAYLAVDTRDVVVDHRDASD